MNKDIIKKRIPVDNLFKIHWEQQKNGFYLFVVLEVILFRLIWFKNNINNVVNSYFFSSLQSYILFKMTLRSCTHWVKLSNKCHMHTHKKV